MDNIAQDAAEADWVDANRDIVERAFASNMDVGEWPPVERVQRELDRAGSSSDVREALRHMPKLPGEMRPWEPAVVAIPLRLLRFTPEAEPVLDLCLAIVRRAVAAYESEADRPVVTSQDLMDIIGVPYALHVLDGTGLPSLSEDEGRNETRRRVQRAAHLLAGSQASPLGSGSYGDDWRFEVFGQMARRYRDVQTIDEYLDRQAEILAEHGKSTPGPAAREPTRLTVFVVMPFGCDWSPGVYELIKRAIASLASADVEIDAYRADDIVAPGKITDQIAAAIEGADAVVADITGTNPNVMWELGYAQAIRKPVVILNQDIAESPFDLRDWRQVDYEPAPTEHDERRVATYIREALALGPGVALAAGEA